MTVSFVAGFSLGASLILAIGPQNAFVLRQGLRREHIFVIVMICAFSDAVLIAAGVGGFSVLVEAAPWVGQLLTYGGAAFLIWYGTRSLVSAVINRHALAPSEDHFMSLTSAVLTCLALTWLNPHVYLDTLLLMGSVSANYDDPLAFGVGATLASVLFFFGLGYGARLLAPLFARPMSWRVLDGLVGVVMCGLAIKVLLV